MEKLAFVGAGKAVHILMMGSEVTECGRLGTKPADEATAATCGACIRISKTDAAREARENATERAALAAGLEAGRPLIEDTETPAPAAPAFSAPRTYTVSEYRKDGALQDTEYAFSDGDKWKVYEAGTITRTRSVKRQEHEGAEYRRAPLATLEGKLKHSIKDGETELLTLDTVRETAPVELTLDPALSVLDAVEIPETPAEPETETISYAVTILKHTPDRVTARILASGMRTDSRLARNLIVSRIAAKMRRNGASSAEITAERKRYVLDAVVIDDDLTKAPGVSKRTYTLDTMDGAHSPIIKRADGTREVKVAGLETLVPAAATSRHLPAPHPATPPNPDLPVTPAGKLVEDVPFFDRSIKVRFKCPLHPAEVYMSKDPYVSSWFPGAPDVHGCPKDCTSKVGEHILVSDYRPTRRG